MTEDEAEAYVRSLDVPRGTVERLASLAALVTTENTAQNLVAGSTLPMIWSRHIADSAQLVPLAAAAKSDCWIDLGSGPGFPGLVVAMVGNRPVTLVEERAKRVGFLRQAVAALGLESSVRIEHKRAERVQSPPAAVISARAFAPLPRLFEIARHLATRDTLWLLPKGRTAAVELEAARASWQGDMRLVPSVTDPDAAIVVATDIRPR